MSCVVYWLFDESCICPWRHGYIGITVNFRSRLKNHRARKKRDFDHKILFRGSEDECLRLEARMRPHSFIGWNWSEGGTVGPRGPKSDMTRQKMREAALRRYADPVERVKMSEALKGRKVTWGDKISVGKLGLKPSDATRARMTASQKGKIRPPRTPEHCAKISASKIGKPNPAITESNRRRKGIKLGPMSAEHRAKLSAAKQNISQETRAKMSVAALARKPRQHGKDGRFLS